MSFARISVVFAAAACVDPSATTDSAKIPDDTGVFVAAPGYQLGAANVSWIDANGEIQSRWWDEHDEAVPPVIAGGFHACGLRTDGGVDCWGVEGYPKQFPLDGTGIIEVGASVNDTCALTADRVPVCSTDE